MNQLKNHIKVQVKNISRLLAVELCPSKKCLSPNPQYL